MVSESKSAQQQIKMISSRQETIKVMARIKPSSRQFKFCQNHSHLNVIGIESKNYALDHVFGKEADGKEVFQKVGTLLVANAFEGYNSTLFVYGQTGTGKTHTMIGSLTEDGIIQMCVDAIRNRLQIESESHYEFYSFTMSYIQIYNETVKDLLTNSEKKVRERTKTGFYVEDLSQISIQNNEEFVQKFNKGTRNRQSRPTNMNLKSSRSHSIVTLLLETKETINGVPIVKTAKLNFVDLAGSEKIKESGATGVLKTEAAHINLSLGTLKQVVNALQAKRDKDITHIPYRNSVLTKILKDSLGGNSYTIIIGTINLEQQSFPETISTLNFLKGARRVKNTTRVNKKIEGNEEKLKQQLQVEQEKVRRLETELTKVSQELKNQLQKNAQYKTEIDHLRKQFLEFQSPSAMLEEMKSQKSLMLINISQASALKCQLMKASNKIQQMEKEILDSREAHQAQVIRLLKQYEEEKKNRETAELLTIGLRKEMQNLKQNNEYWMAKMQQNYNQKLQTKILLEKKHSFQKINELKQENEKLNLKISSKKELMRSCHLQMSQMRRQFCHKLNQRRRELQESNEQIEQLGMMCEQLKEENQKLKDNSNIQSKKFVDLRIDDRDRLQRKMFEMTNDRDRLLKKVSSLQIIVKDTRAAFIDRERKKDEKIIELQHVEKNLSDKLKKKQELVLKYEREIQKLEQVQSSFRQKKQIRQLEEESIHEFPLSSSSFQPMHKIKQGSSTQQRLDRHRQVGKYQSEFQDSP